MLKDLKARPEDDPPLYARKPAERDKVLAALAREVSQLIKQRREEIGQPAAPAPRQSDRATRRAGRARGRSGPGGAKELRKSPGRRQATPGRAHLAPPAETKRGAPKDPVKERIRELEEQLSELKELHAEAESVSKKPGGAKTGEHPLPGSGSGSS